ncbi:hypothetical protein M9458_012783, partial [Cirrhinus mrigala]
MALPLAFSCSVGTAAEITDAGVRLACGCICVCAASRVSAEAAARQWRDSCETPGAIQPRLSRHVQH